MVLIINSIITENSRSKNNTKLTLPENALQNRDKSARVRIKNAFSIIIKDQSPLTINSLFEFKLFLKNIDSEK